MDKTFGDENEHFNLWNEEKKKIHQKKEYPFLNERDIRFIKLGKNIGCEQNGKELFLRPFLIMKKVGTLFRGIPLTTGGKDHSKWYINIPDTSFHDVRHKKLTAKVCLGHAKTIDPRRCTQHIGTVDKSVFEIIKKSLQKMYL